MVIDYDPFPVRAGAGFAFFLHVTNGEPTAGCVAVDANSLNVIMRWLLPSTHPVISIGVGSVASAIIANANAAAARHNPFGHVNSVTGGAGVVKAVGWAADPDNTSARLYLDVYIDNRMRGRYTTGVARPDVAAKLHAGPNQGYAITVTGVPAGRHTVCVYALNTSYGTGTIKTVTGG